MGKGTVSDCAFSQKIQKDDGGHTEDRGGRFVLYYAKIIKILCYQKGMRYLCRLIPTQIYNGVRCGNVRIAAVFYFAKYFLSGKLYYKFDFFLILPCVSEVSDLHRGALIKGCHVFVYGSLHHGPKSAFVRQYIIYHQHGIAASGISDIDLWFPLQGSFASHADRFGQIDEIGHFQGINAAFNSGSGSVFKLFCRSGGTENLCGARRAESHWGRDLQVQESGSTHKRSW